jgi:hypothetical protein
LLSPASQYLNRIWFHVALRGYVSFVRLACRVCEKGYSDRGAGRWPSGGFRVTDRPNPVRNLRFFHQL